MFLPIRRVEPIEEPAQNQCAGRKSTEQSRSQSGQGGHVQDMRQTLD